MSKPYKRDLGNQTFPLVFRHHKMSSIDPELIRNERTWLYTDWKHWMETFSQIHWKSALGDIANWVVLTILVLRNIMTQTYDSNKRRYCVLHCWFYFEKCKKSSYLCSLRWYPWRTLCFRNQYWKYDPRRL